jgi:phospholipid/cholesterol/gamma-HCH transport system permease protein
MGAAIQARRDGNGAHLTVRGRIDLASVPELGRGIAEAASLLEAAPTVEVHLDNVDYIDGSGAVLLARLLDRLEASGHSIAIAPSRTPDAARLVTLYRSCHNATSEVVARRRGRFERIGRQATRLSRVVAGGFDFIGRSARAVPTSVIAPHSVDWGSLPRLMQTVGADGLAVAGAANLLIGVIVAFLGVSQLGRFGVATYVPELVVVAQFRELGPLVTAIVVAGRSGAGLASEIATMKVSEEIDALRAIGLDPVRWLVVPRCVALVCVLPLLTWIGDALALVGGLAATTSVTSMSTRAYLTNTADAIRAADFLCGLIKTPFLALAIGLIACGQGLATHGGAAAVGRRTTAAVVQSIFAVIVVSAFFTLLYVLLGV